MLIDALRLKCRQLSQAVEVGEDDLVCALDRQIEPLMRHLMRREPRSEEELFEQIKIVYELLSQDMADLDSVTDKATVMMMLLDRMFKRRAASVTTVAPAATSSPAAAFAPSRAESAVFEDDIELTQALLDQLPDGVLLVGRDERLLFANKTFCASHDIEPLDCIGAPLAHFMAGLPELCEILSRARQVFETGKAVPAVSDGGMLYDIKPFEILHGRLVAVMILIRSARAFAG